MYPRVGIAAIVKKEKMVFFGKRKGSHGSGTWNFPGGHLEFFETLEECTKREVLEETGLKVKNIKFATITNDFFRKENKHYITIFMICNYQSGKVVLKEPEKCESWDWFRWNSLPKPLFLPIKNLLKDKYNPFL